MEDSNTKRGSNTPHCTIANAGSSAVARDSRARVRGIKGEINGGGEMLR